MFPSDLVIDMNFEVNGEDAQYTPAGGSAVDIRVIPKRSDAVIGINGGQVFSETAVFDVRVSEIAAPKAGDQLVFDSTTYKIQGKPRREDPDRRVWTLDTVPV